jgi:hypothetical protein
MIKIGVIADTHIPIASPCLPKTMLEGLKEVSFIIHAGDLVTLSLLRELEKIAPVYAVYGNMDSCEVRKALPQKRELKFTHFRIGIIHGDGKPSDLHIRLRKEFGEIDIIIFGHSHKPFKQMVDGALMFNPGSPTDRIFTSINTFGIIELNKGIKARHIQI